MNIPLAPSCLAALLLGLALAGSVRAQPASPASTDARSVARVDIAEPALPPAALQERLATGAPAPATPLRVRRIDIGNATQSLLALQRSAPAVQARHIDGAQASRSYQRYLKSFETTIPEHYNTGLGLAKP